MTKEELSVQLEGKEYRKEIPSHILSLAKKHDLVIITGHSDDLMEVEGAIEDEGSCYEGDTFYIDSEGLLGDRDDLDDDELEHWLKRKKQAKKIEAVFCATGQPGWTYKTKIPHATFNVIEGDGDTDVQCRGIVFSLKDL